MLAGKDAEIEDNDTEEEVSLLKEDFFQRHQREKEEVTELISKIPEDKVRELLVGFVLADEGLKHRLKMQYEFKMNSKLMLELRTEIDHIIYRNSRGGYVDWYHASEFTSELSGFLHTKVMLLIEKNCLKQAFELTNLVFHCIGNIDMDDSEIIYKESGELPEQFSAYVFAYSNFDNSYSTIVGFYHPYYDNNKGGVFDGIGAYMEWDQIVAWKCLEGTRVNCISEDDTRQRFNDSK